MKPEIIDTKLDGKVTILKNCLPDDLDHNELFTEYRDDFKFPNNQHGHLRQYEYHAGHNDEKYLPLKKILNVPDEYSMKIGLHEITGGGFIPPHADSKYFGGLTIFLNRSWEKAWGGWAMAYDDDGFYAASPEYGHGVFYRTPLQHCTSPVYQSDQVRRSLQIFFVKDDTWDSEVDKRNFVTWDE